MDRTAAVVTALAVVAGCGRVGFDPLDGTDGGSESSVFEPLRLPAGGFVRQVATTPADPVRVYAVVAGRVMRSDTRGGTWIDCERAGETLVVAPDPTDPNVVYAGDTTGLYRSTDRCGTWAQLAQSAVRTIVLANGDVWFSGDKLYRLRGGVVMQLPTPLDGTIIRGLAVMGTTVIATSFEIGVVWSNDGGASFVVANTGLATPSAAGVTFPIAGDEQTLLLQSQTGSYRSTNGGVTWSSSPGGADGRDAVVADPGDPDFVLASTWHGMQGSTDNGMTFATVPRSALMHNAYCADFAFDPSGSGRVYAATTRGVFVAEDHGLVWADASAGLDGWWVTELTRVPGQPLIYAATEGGLLRSADDGETWTVEAEGMDFRTAQLGTVHVSTTVPDQVWTSGAPWLWQYSDSSRLFLETRAMDASDAWTVNVIRTVGPSRVWFGTGTRLWRSDDNGLVWNAIEIHPVGRYVHDLVIDLEGELWVATDQGLYHSGDDGLTFTLLPTTTLDRAHHTLLLLADDTLVVGTTDGVHARSTTGWARAGLDGVSVHDLITAGDRWIAATSSGVFITGDRGATWTALPGLAQRRSKSLVLDSTGRLLVGTEGFGVFRTALP